MSDTESNPSNAPNQQYTVVARRYRPQSFTDLVGQSHIARALGNAITQNRVGHAYLFTGARGVGKTSSARIFAKCLNCEQGPTSTPCNECDICESVSLGEDVDVLEIDGASNRGIDEIRQLRSNAGVRPGRSRFKIYIIDEVHMLTSQAFNALLKTLEEPPEHVKFIFCTTDPQKIPITVLSRCQRFDFSPVQANEITQRLREIAENEGVQADEKALALLARRAAGSMRDSQSLLEQLFSFCGDSISVEEVHQLLGTTDVGRISELAESMASHDSKEALQLIARAVSDGVDTGQLASQLLSYFRDMMAAHVGCGLETLLSCGEEDLAALTQLASRFGLETILNVVQILDNTVSRMQSSVHSQTLLEVGVVRICNLESLDSLADLVQAISTGKSVAVGKSAGESAGKKNDLTNPETVVENSSAPSPPISAQSNLEIKSDPHESDASSSENNGVAKETGTEVETQAGTQVAPERKKASRDNEPATGSQLPETMANERTDPAQSPGSEPVSKTGVSNGTPREPVSSTTSPQHRLTQENISGLWQQAVAKIGDMTGDLFGQYKKLELSGENGLVVTMPNAYNRDMCNQAERREKIESTFQEVSGLKLRIDFVADSSPATQENGQPKLTRRQQIKKLQELPIVKKTLEIFDADIVNFHEPPEARRT